MFQGGYFNYQAKDAVANNHVSPTTAVNLESSDGFPSSKRALLLCIYLLGSSLIGEKSWRTMTCFLGMIMIYRLATPTTRTQA